MGDLAHTRLREATATLSDEQQASFCETTAESNDIPTQRALTQKLRRRDAARPMSKLDERVRLVLRSAGVPGAGQWLRTPAARIAPLAKAEFRAARLLFLDRPAPAPAPSA